MLIIDVMQKLFNQQVYGRSSLEGLKNANKNSNSCSLCWTFNLKGEVLDIVSTRYLYLGRKILLKKKEN